jgi:hypothetical protein
MNGAVRLRDALMRQPARVTTGLAALLIVAAATQVGAELQAPAAAPLEDDEGCATREAAIAAVERGAAAVPVRESADRSED